MLGVVLTGLLTVLSWLPNSFVQSLIADNLSYYGQIFDILGYINYFFPVYILGSMVALWVPLMIMVFIFYFLSSKL